MSEIFKKLDYDEKSEKKILCSHAMNRYSKETLEKLIINTFNFFKNYGYTDEQMVQMTTTLPPSFSFRRTPTSCA